MVSLDQAPQVLLDAIAENTKALRDAAQKSEEAARKNTESATRMERLTLGLFLLTGAIIALGIAQLGASLFPDSPVGVKLIYLVIVSVVLWFFLRKVMPTIKSAKAPRPVDISLVRRQPAPGPGRVSK